MAGKNQAVQETKGNTKSNRVIKKSKSEDQPSQTTEVTPVTQTVQVNQKTQTSKKGKVVQDKTTKEQLDQLCSGVINTVESECKNESNVCASGSETETESGTGTGTGTGTECVSESEKKPEEQLKFKVALSELRSKVAQQTESLKDLKTSLKKLESLYDHDLSKAVKSKQKRTKLDDKTKATGIFKQRELSKDLAELIGENEGTVMSMPEYTKKFFKMMKENDLLCKTDGRVFRANDKIMKVFNLPASVNESTNHKDKDGFNFCNLQTHISRVNKVNDK